MKFTIELETYEEPKTVMEDKINQLSLAFLRSFNSLRDDYNRFSGELKFNLVKVNLHNEPLRDEITKI